MTQQKEGESKSERNASLLSDLNAQVASLNTQCQSIAKRQEKIEEKLSMKSQQDVSVMKYCVDAMKWLAVIVVASTGADFSEFIDKK